MRKDEKKSVFTYKAWFSEANFVMYKKYKEVTVAAPH